MKKIIIAILLILVLFNGGCKNVTPTTEPRVIEYHTGTDGLSINIVKGLPPDDVIEGGEFVIGLELRNKGAYDIEGGKILVYGFEGGYTTVEQPEAYFNIEGKKPGFPEGGYNVMNFKARNIGMPEVIDVYPTSFTVSAYYRYQTDAGTEVCINPYIYSYIKTKEMVCEPKEIDLKGGQGAPVAVTKIEEIFSPFGNNIRVDFVVHIANKGDGQVVGGVYIGEAKLSDTPISCKPDFVELKGKEEKSIVCTAETLLSSGAYVAPLSVKLVYDYISTVDKKLNIRSLGSAH